jgi:uncharacterized protein YuzE
MERMSSFRLFQALIAGGPVTGAGFMTRISYFHHPEAPAAYIRVSQNPISRTVVLRDDKILSTIDLDASGKIVGIEVVWPPNSELKS